MAALKCAVTEVAGTGRLHPAGRAPSVRAKKGRMLTPEKFRQLALEIADAVESSHMGHPDFRIGGKVFASLGYPDDGHGMVKVAPEHQQTLLKEVPDVFAPCAGAWGKGGATSVHLAAAKVGTVRAALAAAAKNVAAKRKKK